MSGPAGDDGGSRGNVTLDPLRMVPAARKGCDHRTGRQDRRCSRRRQAVVAAPRCSHVSGGQPTLGRRGPRWEHVVIDRPVGNRPCRCGQRDRCPDLDSSLPASHLAVDRRRPQRSHHPVNRFDRWHRDVRSDGRRTGHISDDRAFSGPTLAHGVGRRSVYASHGHRKRRIRHGHCAAPANESRAEQDAQ